MLSYPDSNQDKQNQKLLCYHYTIRQSQSLNPHPAALRQPWLRLKLCKVNNFLDSSKIKT